MRKAFAFRLVGIPTDKKAFRLVGIPSRKKGVLYFQKYFLFIHEIKEEPFYCHDRQDDNNNIKWLADELWKPT